MDEAIYRIALFADTVLSKFIQLACILLVLLSSYALYDSFNLYYHAQDKGILKYKPSLNAGSQADIAIEGSVAWLTINDTNIDYPIMQGKTNSEYLNKDPFGNFALSGSIYLDSRNNPDFSDSYSLIYGHHMQHGVMFGSLDEYREEKYFKEHQDGVLTVAGKESHPIKIFAVMDCLGTDDKVFSVKEYEDRVQYYKDNAIHFEEQDEYNHILALTTCSDTINEKRLAVFAVILP